MLRVPATRLADLKAADISRNVGRTIGAFYSHWENQDEYRATLVSHIMSPAYDISFDSTTRLARQAKAEGGSGSHVWANSLLGSLMVHEGFRPRMVVYQELETIPAAASLYTDYYDRQQANVGDSLSAALDIKTQRPDNLAITYTSEDMAMRSMRNFIDPADARLIIAQHIPA